MNSKITVINMFNKLQNKEFHQESKTCKKNIVEILELTNIIEFNKLIDRFSSKLDTPEKN